jgi:hypothetical protein
MLHRSLDTRIVMTTYDAKGRPVRRSLYDEDDRVIRRVALSYDLEGRLIEEGEIGSGNQMRGDLRNVYRYDAGGRRIEAEAYWSDLGGERRFWCYNDQGDPTEERTVPTAGIMEEIFRRTGREGRLMRFTYEYDERRNWTHRTTDSQTLQKLAFGKPEVCKRKLSYWD